MLLASVRELKAAVRSELSGGSPGRGLAPGATRILPAEIATALAARIPIAVGITAGGKREYRLAVRVRQVIPGIELILEHVRRRARGEVDIRVVGRIAKQAPRQAKKQAKKQAPWHQRRNRPLRIGSSIGHVNVTAGTLGCFVAPRDGGDGIDLILSNNHVLADEDRAAPGDPIVQPGRADGGRRPRDIVAHLDRSVALRSRGRNIVDAAAARIVEGTEYYSSWIDRGREVRGVRSSDLAIGERVYKVGRTTGFTEGRVSALEVDDLVVGYDRGELMFDDQIEIEWAAPGSPFSRGGDSGSLVVDARGRAIGLLFAGNDADTTYVNPIGRVLDALKVDLVV